MVPSRSHVRAWGAMVSCPKARAMSKMAVCSSVRAKSMPGFLLLGVVASELNACLIINSCKSFARRRRDRGLRLGKQGKRAAVSRRYRVGAVFGAMCGFSGSEIGVEFL